MLLFDYSQPSGTFELYSIVALLGKGKAHSKSTLAEHYILGIER
jgi:hypothetical protein